MTNDKKWSNSAKVGAAVGSAAVMAALMFANRGRGKAVDSAEGDSPKADDNENRDTGLDDHYPPETD